ncbi:MAG: lysylphosphatidylglycerol synthase transmembrane domain-containing protein [bacterium]
MGISGLFLWLIAAQVDLHLLVGALRSIDLRFFSLAFLFFMLSEVPVAVRLLRLLKPTVLQPTFVRILTVDIISRFYAAFLPAGVGTNLFRWYKITGNRSGRGQFLVVLAVEKILFLATTLFASGMPLLLIEDDRLAPFKRAFLPVFWSFAALVCLLFLYLLIPSLQDACERLTRPLASRLPARLRVLWDKVVAAGRLYQGAWKVMGWGLVLSVCVQLCLLLLFLCLFFALRVHLPVLDILWISSLVFLVQTLPISLAGIGVRESGFAYLLGLYGIPPEKGVLIGVLFGALFLIRCLVGVGLYLAERRAPRP